MVVSSPSVVVGRSATVVTVVSPGAVVPGSSGSASSQPVKAIAAERARATTDRDIFFLVMGFLLWVCSQVGPDTHLADPANHVLGGVTVTPDGVLWCMARTNIDIDEDLIRTAMDRYGLRTKKEAVDLALRKLVGGVMTKEEALAMEGYGWSGDLDMIRSRDEVEVIWE